MVTGMSELGKQTQHLALFHRFRANCEFVHGMKALL